ncbi:MAG: hypothetical protein M3P83_11435, partial [Actinomycetota bacterium]|nr:hypothetical protein [Actinomycetota bacterium]
MAASGNADTFDTGRPLRRLMTRTALVAAGVCAIAVVSVLELVVLGGYRETFGRVVDGRANPTDVVAEVQRLAVTDIRLTVYGGAAWVLTAAAGVSWLMAVRRLAGSVATLISVLGRRRDVIAVAGCVAALVAAVSSEAVGDQLMRTAGSDRAAFLAGARWATAGNLLALVAAALAILLLTR